MLVREIKKDTYVVVLDGEWMGKAKRSGVPVSEILCSRLKAVGREFCKERLSVKAEGGL